MIAACSSEEILDAAPLENSNYTATYLPSLKRSMLYEQDMLVTAGELITDALLWTPTHRHTSVDRPAKTFIHQLCPHTRMSSGGLAMSDDHLRERERERETSAFGTS